MTTTGKFLPGQLCPKCKRPLSVYFNGTTPIPYCEICDKKLLTEALLHLEFALYYADPPHPAAKDRLNDAQQFLDKHKIDKFPQDLRRKETAK